MKIDRRCFLSLAIGAGAGIALSPLPWKLTDDLAIWTQNWQWTPVPKRGAAKTVNSVCTLCPGGCGISVRKIDDRAVKIEGMETHPVNRGGICTLGLCGLQLLYGPTRVKGPLKRVADRGKGQWMPITWDQAIREVTEKLSAIRKSGRPQSVATMSGASSATLDALLDRFGQAYGTPNTIRFPSVDDAYHLSVSLMSGGKARVAFDFEHAGYVLSFGAGLLDGWGSPVRMFKANALWKQSGVKLVQVEPRLSRTAAKADTWISIVPGSETALALAMAHVIISESLYQAEFVESCSEGMEGFKEFVAAKYTPDIAAKMTGVDAATITMLAREFAKSKRPIAVCGRGQGTIPGSMDMFMATQVLNALVGNLNQPGGVWFVTDQTMQEWPEVEPDAAAKAGLAYPRLDGAKGMVPLKRSLPNQFVQAVASGKDYPIEALLVIESNPLYTLNDTALVKQAFSKIPFIVSFSSFMDDTAAYADMILPNPVYLERMEDVIGASGFPYPTIGLSQPVVKPQCNTRHVGDVLIQLAKGLGDTMARAFAWKDFSACLEASLGDRFKTLKKSVFQVDKSYQPPAPNEIFASERFSFIPRGIQADVAFKPIAAEGDTGGYPLMLMAYDTMRLSNGYIGNPPFLTKILEDTVLKNQDCLIEINPKSAKAAGLDEGDRAEIQTPKGKALVRIHLDDGIMPGIVAIPRGLGHEAYDVYLAGKGINVNSLVGSLSDPISGFEAAWGIRAKLSKA
ncbi:menaquinone reductase molybdopterin-binding-like subunit QrcB [Desulfatirhabdium butyrativorans]|uniref:menaquinone reductase molybdopterin-binding-like subunit QrcB n=1 Tax=Desulfatirhabdium butyrativorans TaxID=340467 RepID=UPI000427316A|nr:menaquinone reductase molybdopterin-binding-like subunit QrcB [Desulfatirhabdium butyrativorans]